MRRRYFLRTMAAISAVAAGLPVMMPAQDPLDAGLGDVEAMRALGRRYLDLHPEETAAARSWRAALISAGQPGMRRTPRARPGLIWKEARLWWSMAGFCPAPWRSPVPHSC